MDSVKQFHLQDRSVEKPVGDSSGDGVASRPQEGMDCSQSVCVCVCARKRALPHTICLSSWGLCHWAHA